MHSVASGEAIGSTLHDPASMGAYSTASAVVSAAGSAVGGGGGVARRAVVKRRAAVTIGAKPQLNPAAVAAAARAQEVSPCALS